MWTIFRKSAKTGIVTRDIGLDTDAPGFQGPPHIDFGGCTACGQCTETCPASALVLICVKEQTVLNLDIGRCVYCGRCSTVCPEKVMTPSPRFLWATKNYQDLYVRGWCGRG
jgi:hydrogenase-4 component H